MTSAAVEPQWLRYESTIALRLIVLGAAFCFVMWAVLKVQIVAVGAFIGFAQVALLWPLVKAARRFLPNIVATLLVSLTYFAAFFYLTWFVVRGLVDTLPDMVQAVVGGLQALEAFAVEQGWEASQGFIDTVTRQLQETAGSIASGIGQFAMTGVSVASTFVSILVIATFLTLFALTSGDSLWKGALSTLPRRRRPQADRAFRRAFVTARWWMFASTATGLVDGIFIGAGLWLLGVPLAVPIGAATFVLGYIPMIGATAAGILAVIVALFFGGPQTALLTVLLVLAVQQIEGNVLSPLLLSRAVSFHPVITLLLSTGAGLAFGVTGLFLAVPVAGIVVAMVTTWKRVGPHDGDGAQAFLPEPFEEARQEESAPPETDEEEAARRPAARALPAESDGSTPEHG